MIGSNVGVLFAWEHLPPSLQDVSRPFSELAKLLLQGPYNFETEMALRKLLEAKDCAVRSRLPLSASCPTWDEVK